MGAFLKVWTCSLLFFIVFAFAGAEPWAFSVLQVGLFTATAGLLCYRRTFTVTPLLKIVLGTLGFLVLFCTLQASFPTTLLSVVPWFPASLMPLFTWEHASLFITYAAVVAVVSQLADCSKALKQFALAVGLCGLAVALCALCLPDGEYIRLLVGIRGGMGPVFNRNHAGIFLAMGAVVSLGYGVASFLDYARFAAEHRMYFPAAWQMIPLSAGAVRRMCPLAVWQILPLSIPTVISMCPLAAWRVLPLSIPTVSSMCPLAAWRMLPLSIVTVGRLCPPAV